MITKIGTNYNNSYSQNKTINVSFKRGPDPLEEIGTRFDKVIESTAGLAVCSVIAYAVGLTGIYYAGADFVSDNIDCKKIPSVIICLAALYIGYRLTLGAIKKSRQ